MPTLPWVGPGGTKSEVLVMASRLEVRRLREVPGFFLASVALWRQARRSSGVHGLGLKAELLKRTFWTVSAWSDKKALYAYARAEPHHSTMRRLRSVTHESTFVFWTAEPGELPITWTEVKRRIADQRAAEALNEAEPISDGSPRSTDSLMLPPFDGRGC
ncbi:hypothetical protein ACQEU6_02360 [Spirillospora sp. CA-108201]